MRKVETKKTGHKKMCVVSSQCQNFCWHPTGAWQNNGIERERDNALVMWQGSSMSQYEETLVEISPWKGEKERDAIIAHLTCSSLGLSCRKETILDGMQSPNPCWFMASSQEWYNRPTYMETDSKSRLLLRLCSNMEKRHVVSWTMCLYIISLSCLAWGPPPSLIVG